MKVLVFDVKGRYAHFKAFETTRENISFPFPPKTALLGMIASILGIKRNRYWISNHPLASSLVSLSVLKPIHHIGLKVNYVQTRNPIKLSGRNVVKDVLLMLPRDPFEIETKDQRGSRAPIRLDLLTDVYYRVTFSSTDENLFSSLKKRLEEQKYFYPPYLGHANFFAAIEYCGTFTAEPLPEGIYSPHSIVPVNAIHLEKISIDSVGTAIIYNVPCAMKFIGEDEKEIKSSEMILGQVGNFFLNFGNHDDRLKAYFKDESVYRLSLDDDEQLICFYP